MRKAIQKRLLHLNRRFYEEYAGSFSRTRGRVQPGVARLVREIGREDAVLDVGCGNGTLARALAARGFSGSYTGLDLSTGLLESAADLLGYPQDGTYRFLQRDLANPEWARGLNPEGCDWLLSFAVFHHLPGRDLRRRIARDLAGLLRKDGRLALSVWQWHNSPRLRKRVLPWSQVGLSDSDVDPGDVLLEWRGGEGVGYRYVHTFDVADLESLGEWAGFSVVETFLSDGKPGNLALYQVWKKAEGNRALKS